MKEPSDTKSLSKLNAAAQALFDFAIDRDDIKWCLGQLPQEESLPYHRIDYELQLLKIVTTGWSIAVHLADDPHKEPLTQAFWTRIMMFSKELSQTTELMTGCDVNYFELLRERLDDYVAVIAKQQKGDEPARFIGARFAQLCDRPDDLALALAGSRIFHTIVMRVEKFIKDQDLPGTLVQ